jgi:hypothetical protein
MEQKLRRAGCSRRCPRPRELWLRRLQRHKKTVQKRRFFELRNLIRISKLVDGLNRLREV